MSLAGDLRPGKTATLRPAAAGDHAALVGIRQRAAWSNPADRAFLAANPAATQVDATAIDRGAIWVAESGGAIRGFAEMRVANGKAEIRGLFVDPDRQRRGLGRTLADHCLATARRARATGMQATANPAARGFWKSLGDRQSATILTANGPTPRTERPLTERER